VVEAVKGLKSAGVDVVAYGMNSPETDRRAPYDFFASIVCRMSSFSANLSGRSSRRVGTITSSKWNVSGDAQDFEAVLLGNARMARLASS